MYIFMCVCQRIRCQRGCVDVCGCGYGSRGFVCMCTCVRAPYWGCGERGGFQWVRSASRIEHREKERTQRLHMASFSSRIEI